MGNLKNLFYSSLFSGVVMGALSVILPVYLSDSFHTSLTAMGFIFSAYALLFALLQVPSSFLGDRFRRRRILIFSAILDGIAVFIYGIASNVTHFLFGKGVEGVSSSIGMAPSNALLTELSEKHRFSESFGNLIGYFSVGYVLGLALAGPLVDFFGYRRAILSLLSFQLVALAFTFMIKREEHPKKIKFNILKFFHKPHRNLKILAFTGMVIGAVECMDATVTVIFLKEVYNASLTEIGLVMGLVWLAYGLAQILSGRYSDKFGRKKIYLYAGLIAGISAFFIPNMGSIAGMVFFFILLSIGHGIAFPAVFGIMAESTSDAYRSQDFGLVSTFESIGAFIGLPLVGLIADGLGFNMAFYLRGVVIISAAAVVYLLVKEKKNRDENKIQEEKKEEH